MRTTLTLDDDVAKLLSRIRKERDASFRQVVNEALRRGLQAPATKPAKPYRMKTWNSGPPLMNLDNIGEVLERLDGPDYR